MNLAALARSDDRQRQVLAEHRGIAAAVEARELDEALRLVDQHLGATLALLHSAAASDAAA
jgi:DNA-binding GntR family transcriptional regulator